MEPEEEWEREGLLDPAWEKQQKKVNRFSIDLTRFFVYGQGTIFVQLRSQVQLTLIDKSQWQSTFVLCP
jgi:hypothetical protein